MDFSSIKNWTIPEGNVIQVANSQNNVIWNKSNYFYVEDVSGSDNTLSIQKDYSSIASVSVYKSTDQSNWIFMGTTSTTPITATIPANGKLYLKCTTDKWGTYNDDYNGNYINATSSFNVGGNIMSLIYGDRYMRYQDDFPRYSTYTFSKIFKGATTLISASELELPATTLVQFCYQYMFADCTSLIQAPALPAETLALCCYYHMFNGCTSLTAAPELPATTIIEQCYSYMFDGCTSLTQAPALPATTLEYACYRYMFNGCTSLETAPALPVTTLANACYEYMFYGCTGLTQAPTLPATTLTARCYNYMFRNCKKIKSVTTYATDISASSCLNNWMNGVSSTGDFYNLGGATYTRGTSGIPTGWTEHTSI